MTVGNTKVIGVGKSPKKYLFHSRIILSTFLWKGKFFDSTSRELLLLRFFVFFWVAICVWWLARPLTWSGEWLKIFWRCWTTYILQVSNILDLQHVHMFIINPMTPMANTELGIEFEYVNMLNIWNVWNLSDAFAFILAQQRPVLVSAHAQNFFRWSLAAKKLTREMQIAELQRQVYRWLTLQMKDIYHIWNFVERLQCEFSCIVNVLRW